MDMALPPEEEKAVRRVLDSHSFQFVNFHAFRGHKSGPERFVDLHLVVDRSMCVLDAHQPCEMLEKEIEAALPHTSVLFHLEPCEDRDCPYSDKDKFIHFETDKKS